MNTSSNITLQTFKIETIHHLRITVDKVSLPGICCPTDVSDSTVLQPKDSEVNKIMVTVIKTSL